MTDTMRGVGRKSANRELGVDTTLTAVGAKAALAISSGSFALAARVRIPVMVMTSEVCVDWSGSASGGRRR